jgi:hypothetical protein
MDGVGGGSIVLQVIAVALPLQQGPWEFVCVGSMHVGL